MKVRGMATPQAAAGLRLYKIAERSAWNEARSRGRFDGSPDDVRDGYIHLSAENQIVGTLARHFAGAADLVLIEIDAAALGAALRWEPARGGQLFPHLHAPLGMSAVRSERTLELGPDGRHRLPGGPATC
jgi:uncharacterized protein (DUF952 family)